jgi:hypothetical protein
VVRAKFGAGMVAAQPIKRMVDAGAAPTQRLTSWCREVCLRGDLWPTFPNIR